ncbi:MAG: hypothetical protein H0W70_11935 [Actinobacteria bacterium]|nr:hypothetical protein [Actinomycetota bacterium]
MADRAPRPEVDDIVDRLLAAYDDMTLVAPISDGDPAFDGDAAYEVLHRIGERRVAQGWVAAGRKIGFTNRTIWPLYGVDAPMWAHMWDRTVRFASHGEATFDLTKLVQPRIEPEVVFKLRAGVPVTDDPVAVLSAVEWVAPGFEIVQCHYPDWRFTLADCTASFGLHGALVVGSPVVVDDHNRDALAARLATFEGTLSRDGDVVDRGVGSNVLDSPALALVHLARVLEQQPQFAPLSGGEVITTGTITNAWAVAPDDTWQSDYGDLGITGLRLTFT